MTGSRFIILLIGLLGLIGYVEIAWAESGSVKGSAYYEFGPGYDYLVYAINSGRLQVGHVLNQPFHGYSVLQAIARHKEDRKILNQHWTRLLFQDLSRYVRPSHADENDGAINAGVLGSYQGLVSAGHQWTQYRLGLHWNYILPYFTASQRTVSDQALRRDPLYLGDNGEWVFGRVETGYVTFRYKALLIFGGRMARNWGIFNEPSLILSNNPYSYEHYGFELANNRFGLSYYTTRLDDRDGIDVEAANPRYEVTKRYLAVQRFNFNFSHKLQVAMTEAAIYGGPGQTMASVYLNPMNLYYIAQRNDRVQMSGLWSLDLFYKPARPLTLYAQWLIDDIVVNNEPGQNDRQRHPDRMGVSVKVVGTDLITAADQLSFYYTRIGNWTYMSYRSWENYLFESKSLGYPLNSVEKFELGYDGFNWAPWMVKLRVGFQQHGQQDMREPFGDTRSAFPIGIVEKKQYADVSVAYVPYYNLRVNAGARWEKLENAENVKGASKDQWMFMMSVEAFLNYGFWF